MGERFLALDSLRGLLACTIVVFHMPSDGSLWMLGPVRNGFLAVTFFFVLSGFVIGNTYGQRLAQGFSMSRFLGLRFGRIYPLHLFLIALIAAYEGARWLFGWGAVRAGLPFTGLTAPQELPYNLLLVQSFAGALSWNTQSWSIGTEWWTYVAFAALAAMLGWRGRLFPAALLLMLPSAVTRLLHGRAGHGWDATAGCMLAFGLGLLICELRRSAAVQTAAERLPATAATAIEIVTAAFVLWMMARFGGKLSPLIAPTFTVGIAVFSFERGTISRWLTIAPMLLLGELSYSIYMVHHFVLDRALDLLAVAGRGMSLPIAAAPTGRIVLTGNWWMCDLFTALVLALVIAASRLTFAYVETPARLWSRRLVNPRHDPKASPRDPTAAF